MSYLDYLLWGYFIVNPIYVYFTFEKEKQSVIDQPAKRITLYRSTILHLCLPTLILLFLVATTDTTMYDIGFKWQWGLANQIAVTGLVLLSGYLLLSLKQLSVDTVNHQAVRKQIAYIQWFMPTTIKESRLFIIGVSITAGVCEELLFRGYLMHLLTNFLPIYGVVIVSSLAFGLPHIYQGPIHIIRTTIFGVVMAMIYLLTDSILVPIFLHALLDMYGGAMAYIVLRKQPCEMMSEQS